MKIYTLVLTSIILLSISDLISQNFSKEEFNFLKNNSKSILVNDSSSEYMFGEIESKIGGKRFILIGEPNHGSREVFLLRNELIKYLNKSFECNVILFESGIGELLYPNFNKTNLSPTQMTYGLFGPWRTSEFTDLMKYVKAEKMQISGFDVQRTGRSFERLIEEISIHSKLDSVLYLNVESRFGKLKSILSNRKIEYSDSIKLQTDELILDYNKLYSKLINIEVSLPLKKSLMVLKTIQNRIGYLRYMLDFKINKDWNKRWADRDSLMAENVIWLSEVIYPNEKIVIVGHNFHISKYNEKEEVMGEFLMKKYPNKMYCIGVYAESGMYLGNYGNEKKLTKADKNSLDIKHIIESLSPEISFLHIPKKSTIGDEWLHNKIITNDTFVDLSNSNTLILAKNYDGLVLLKNISTPKK